MRAWRLILLAWNGLRRTPLRFALTVLGVTIATGALVSMVAFALGVQERAETPFRTLGLLDVIHVSPRKADDSAQSPALDDDALTRVQSLPGVVVVCPDFRMRGIKITCGDKTETVVALGLPRQVPVLGVADNVFAAGGYFQPGDVHQAILGKRLALDLGFPSAEDAVGATLTLEASGLGSPLPAAGETPGVKAAPQSATFTFQQAKLAVQVVGVYDVPELLMGPMAKAVLLPVELMKDIPGAQFEHTLDRLTAGKDPAHAGYRGATVRVSRHADLVPVEQAIQAMGYDTRSLLGQLEEMRAFFLFIDVLLAAVGTVALVVAGLGILNTLLIAVLERQQEIGIYKAIGASDRDLVVLFLTEAGTIGLAGGLGGIALGRLVSWLLEIGINAFVRGQGVTAYLSVFAFPAWLLIGAVLFSAVVSIVAGVYPALRAARIDPIISLRRD
jgi:putative ABC transport system permease protein